MSKEAAKEATTEGSGNLILSRHKGESIVIDHPCGQIVVTVTRIRGNRVGLRVEAPLRMNIRRSELEPEAYSQPITEEPCPAS